MTAPRTPTEVLKDARRRDSHQKRARVFAAVDEIKHTDTPITFALIAAQPRYRPGWSMPMGSANASKPAATSKPHNPTGNNSPERAPVRPA
ncbi:Uncharacterised protein [Mycobacteroides abscessus subsp. abscessus]|nr:Uncharacterised protein [Mycobacteroides abscessus]SHS16197.1 Uncharacterised protein [Mycobacteroides abscessus subsp. abscessus]CPR56986.1 Uncharacterised protein [Mycobacteroides abscessus]CPS22389.1 Uncharacterised protein [Mycobacteroides abscessus]CPU79889.1 Uncharacterised protein [Mycobacteroides abscessus]